MRLSSIVVFGTSGALVLGVGAAGAENSGEPVPAVSVGRRATVQQQQLSRPFAVGEKLTYNAKINFLHVGSGTMTVVGIEEVRAFRRITPSSA